MTKPAKLLIIYINKPPQAYEFGNARLTDLSARFLGAPVAQAGLIVFGAGATTISAEAITGIAFSFLLPDTCTERSRSIR